MQDSGLVRFIKQGVKILGDVSELIVCVLAIASTTTFFVHLHVLELIDKRAIFSWFFWMDVTITC